MHDKFKYTGNKLIDNKEKYPILCDFLISKGISLLNVFIVDTPKFYLYFTNVNSGQYGNIYKEAIEMEYSEYSNLLFNNCQIFVYPAEEMNLKFKIQSNYKYVHNLRMYYETHLYYIKQLERLNKMKRIIGYII